MVALAAPVTLWVRDNVISNDVNNVKSTFSSWDNCMAKDYCKYPVIIAIVIASLILLSVLTCLARCLCCGLECCCGCFSCLNTCCSCCQPRRRRWGDNDDYRGGPPGGGPYGNNGGYGGYQAPPAPPVYVNVQAPSPGRYEPTRQFAAFDAPSRSRSAGPTSYGNDDSLPAMPSWNDAKTNRIETEEEDVEMDHLYNTQAQRAPLTGGAASHAAAAGASRGMAPTPSVQTPGSGLYRDEVAHGSGDVADAYHYDEVGAAGYGAAGAVAGAGAGAGAAHYGQQQYGQQHYDQQQQSGVTGYAPTHHAFTPPPAAAYGAPAQQQQYREHAASPPPPTYHTGPVSPISTPPPGVLPSSLATGQGSVGGFQAPPPPAQHEYQAYGGQQSGVTGESYTAYQGRPRQGTWHDV